MSRKKDDFFFWIGPEILPPKYLDWLGARFTAKGLREFRLSSLKLKNACPRHLSEPGLVSISMRPKPSRSYSAEKGFWSIRISRMESFGGSCPPVNPSM